MTATKLALHEMFMLNWTISIDQNRLLYNHIKYIFANESDVYKIRNKRNRSLFARFRVGCLNPKTETNCRWRGIRENRALCAIVFLLLSTGAHTIITIIRIRIRVIMNVFCLLCAEDHVLNWHAT